jgi:seryl-tRNA synthetase
MRRVARSFTTKPQFNLKHLCENQNYTRQNILNRNVRVDYDRVVQLYHDTRQRIQRVNQLRHDRNERSRQLAKDRTPDTLQAAKMSNESLKVEESALATLESEFVQELSRIPNDTHPDAPLGDASHAKVVTQHGTTPVFDFVPKDHVELMQRHDLLDLTGGLYYLKNQAALLELALVQYSMSKCMDRGFMPVLTPDMVHRNLAKACGFAPRDDTRVSQTYTVHPEYDSCDQADYVLAATAEIPLAGMFADKRYLSSDLPRRVVGLGRSFRAEAGSHGKDTRGLYRVHQFTKVEMFIVGKQEDSEEHLAELVSLQQEIVKGLGLVYRVLDMPSEELGNSAYRKYDVEAWMPGRGEWGEVSSASNCTDYQARRLNLRYSDKDGLVFAHTLNATACAVPRVLIALLENNQDAHGNIQLPSVLEPWMKGQLCIRL